MSRFCWASLAVVVGLGLRGAAADGPESRPEHALRRIGSVRLLHGSAIRALAFSADGKSLIAGDDDGLLAVWSLTDGSRRQAVDTSDGRINAVAAAADGRYLATGHFKTAVHVWSASDGRERTSLQHGQQAVWAVAFAPDGRSVVSAGGDGTVRMLSLADGANRVVLASQVAWGSLRFSPDGTRLLLAGQANATEPHSVQIVSVADGKVLARHELHGRQAVAAAFVTSQAADGSVKPVGWVSVGLDGELWRATADAASGEAAKLEDAQPKRVATGCHAGVDWAISLSPNGAWLLSADSVGPTGLPERVALRRTDTGEVVRHWRSDPAATAAAVSADGKLIACGDSFGRIRVYSTWTGAELLTELGHTGALTGAVLLADGRTLVTAGLDRTVRFWDAETGQALREPLTTEEPVACLAASPDGKRIAYAHVPDPGTGRRSADPVVMLLGPDGKLIAELGCPGRPSRFLAFSPDSSRLVGGTDALTVWSAADGKLLARVQDAGSIFDVRSGAFTPDGATLLTLTGDQGQGNLRLMSPLDGKPIRKATGHESAERIATSPDGWRFATASPGGTVRIWEVATGAAGVEISVPEGYAATALAYAPRGRWLLVGSESGRVHVFDGLTGESVADLIGHRGAITSLSVSADGRRLVTGSADTTAIVWDLAALSAKWSAWRPKPAASADFDGLWRQLASDKPRERSDAVRELVAGGEPAARALAARTPVFNKKFHEELARLIAELDHDEFKVRERASERLRLIGAPAEATLRETLATTKSAEVRNRLQTLLESFEKRPGVGVDSPSELAASDTGWQSGLASRPLRIVQVLERLATMGVAPARAHLEVLAGGPDSLATTWQAAAALARVKAERPVGEERQ